MKFNKWTYGLAAVGAVSLASAARADEAPMSAVQTALSNTTISGYVSASANYQLTPSNGHIPYSPAGAIPLQAGKANGFNLDVVDLTISKAEDESPWASGYLVELWLGPDASGYNNSISSITGSSSGNSDIGIKQAYVTLRTPVGNGIDWKIGVFDTIVGYESANASVDPNYTRSWGWSVEPTEHTGVLATYQINDEWTVSAGIANTSIAGINARSADTDEGLANNGAWQKTFMGSVAFTAPSNWGWAAGSSLYAGIVYGFGDPNFDKSDDPSGGNQVNYYLGATLNTPLKQLTLGAAFDYVQNLGGSAGNTGFYSYGIASYTYHVNDYVYGLYATYKATDKLSFSGRAEYFEADLVSNDNIASDNGVELTGTVEYDLWANVITRLEVRWDHIISGTYATQQGYYTPNGYYIGGGYYNEGSPAANRSSLGIYANVIYKF